MEFEGAKLRALRDLALYKKISKKPRLTLTNISVAMNISMVSPYYNQIVKFLKQENIIYVAEKHSKNYVLYNIDYKKLVKLIDEQFETNKWREYFYEYHALLD